MTGPTPWPFARTVVDRDEVPSTSDLARELVEAGDPALPLLVRAGRQTQGRGGAPIPGGRTPAA